MKPGKGNPQQAATLLGAEKRVFYEEHDKHTSPLSGCQSFSSLNREQFFRWDKKLIENKSWALLPKSAKAIFPVIAVHCDEQGRAFPGERTIAILSGRKDKKVREGIGHLQDFPPVTVKHYVTKNGSRGKRFHLRLPKVEKGTAFLFHRTIIEGGNWGLLKPVGQALFPVMRYFGFFNPDLHMEIDNPDGDVTAMDFEEVYRDRVCDYCEAEKGRMRDLAGISKRSMAGALRDLQKHQLIEPIPPNDQGITGWKVFLHPLLHSNPKKDRSGSKVP